MLVLLRSSIMYMSVEVSNCVWKYEYLQNFSNFEQILGAY